MKKIFLHLVLAKDMAIMESDPLLDFSTFVNSMGLDPSWNMMAVPNLEPEGWHFPPEQNMYESRPPIWDEGLEQQGTLQNDLPAETAQHDYAKNSILHDRL